MIIINILAFLVNLAIPYVCAFLGNFLGNFASSFEEIAKPQFTPPGIVFPIVWFILFTLMGISSYLIYKSNSKDKKSALIIYGIQLVLNALWSLFFFNLNWYLFSFIWILLMIFFVALMIYKFYKINKLASYIQIPYLLWLIFASVLNFSIYLLNK